MVAKWFGEYRKLLEKTELISKLATFFVMTFTFWSLYDWLQIYLTYPGIIE